MTIETSVVTDEEFEQLARLPDYVRKGPGCIAREENGVFYVVIAQSVDDDENALSEAVKAEWDAQQKGIRPGSEESESAAADVAAVDGAPAAEKAAGTTPDNPHELVEFNGKLIPKRDRDAHLRMFPEQIPDRPPSSRPMITRSDYLDVAALFR
jgi:hypothetical protein